MNFAFPEEAPEPPDLLCPLLDPRSHNARADEHGYTTGINQFADMTSAEFKKTMLT